MGEQGDAGGGDAGAGNHDPAICMKRCCMDESLKREAPKTMATTTTPTRTLLEIDADFLALLATLEDGEIGTSEAEAAFDRLMGSLAAERDTKLDGCAAVVRELTLRAAARREEAERLAKRVKADESSLSWLKARMMAVLEHAGLKRVETRRFKITVAGNGGVQPVDVMVPAEQLPEKYQRHSVTADVDSIRKDLLAGVVVPECVLVARGTHLRIS